MTADPSRIAKLAPALTALMMLAAAPAHAAKKPQPEAPPPQAAPAEASGPTVSDPEAQFHIMTGEMAAARAQPGLAATEFLAALRSVNDPALAARATGLAFASGNLTLVQATAKRWLEIEPNSMDAREVMLHLALQADDIAEAYAQSDVIVNGHGGGRDDGFRDVALQLAQEGGRPEPSLAVLKRLADQYPQESGAFYAQGLVALRYEKIELAESSAREAVRLSDSKDNTLLLIGILVRQSKLDESDRILDGLTRKNSHEREDLRMAYAKLLLESNQREGARRQIDRVLKDNPKNVDARYALGVFNINDGQLAAAKKLFESLSKDPERGTDAHFQLGRIAEQQKDYDAALKQYEAVSNGTQALDAAVRRAAVLAKLGRSGEARAQLAQMREQFPPLSRRLTLAEGEILLEAGRPEEALASYANGLAEKRDDADLLYGRSLVYDQMGNKAAAEADLRAILEKQPDDARALNALGYMLTAGPNNRLPEAESLIAKALAIDPTDAAIIDSMGWLQFKLGKAENARSYLQKAFDQTNDPEIAAHLGEVLWTLGQRDEARAVWTKALADKPDHRVLKETMQRLSQ